MPDGHKGDNCHIRQRFKMEQRKDKLRDLKSKERIEDVISKSKAEALDLEPSRSGRCQAACRSIMLGTTLEKCSEPDTNK